MVNKSFSCSFLYQEMNLDNFSIFQDFAREYLGSFFREETFPEINFHSNVLSSSLNRRFILSTPSVNIELRKNILVVSSQNLDFSNFKNVCLTIINRFTECFKPIVFYTGVVGTYDCGNIESITFPKKMEFFKKIDTFNFKFGFIDSERYYVNHSFDCVKNVSSDVDLQNPIRKPQRMEVNNTNLFWTLDVNDKYSFLFCADSLYQPGFVAKTFDKFSSIFELGIGAIDNI